MTAEELSKHEIRKYYGTYQSNKLIKSKKDLDELKYDVLKKVI